MTITLTERRRVARHRRALAYWGVLLAMCTSLWLGTVLSPPQLVHVVALFVHLASVIVGLGAAVMLEISGLFWMRGRATLGDLMRTEGLVTALAWLGIVGLIASGALLQPNLQDPLTALKMGAVLVVALNGVAMTRMTAELSRMPARTRFATLPASMKKWCVRTGVISQAGWWTAVIVGMLNSTG